MEKILNIVTAMLLLMVAYIDNKIMEIPDKLLAALGICSLVSCLLNSEITILERMLGFLVVSVPMYAVCLVIPEAFGGGDIKLIAVMGLYLGWKSLLVGTYFGFLIGGVQAAGLLLMKRVRKGDGTHMAFGPALCVGMMIAMIWGPDLWCWYIG